MRAASDEKALRISSRSEAADRHYIFDRGVAVSCKVIPAKRLLCHHTTGHGPMRVVSTSAAEGVTELRGRDSMKFQNARHLQHILGPYSPPFCTARSSKRARWLFSIRLQKLDNSEVSRFSNVADSALHREAETHRSRHALKPAWASSFPSCNKPAGERARFQFQRVSSTPHWLSLSSAMLFRSAEGAIRTRRNRGFPAATPSISAEDFELAPLISQRCRSSCASMNL